MMWLADGVQMRNIDRAAIEHYGIPGHLLMEAASCFVARIALEVFQPSGVIVVTGSGNNGGDGWGAARHLAARKIPVRVVTSVDPASLRGDAAAQFIIYDRYGLPWEQYYSEEQLSGGALIVDALLGTGISGPPRGLAAEIISALNAIPTPVLAVDIPSGLPSSCQPAPGRVVRAAGTASLGLAKAGLYTPTGRQAAGKIYVDAIGLPPQLLEKTGLILNDDHNAAQGLPGRKLDSNKGSFGHGLLVSGSRGMSGAAILAGNSALRSGIGLLTIVCPDEVDPVIQGSLWEALSLPMSSTEIGTFTPDATLPPDLGKYSAAAIGPGCSICPGTQALVGDLLQSSLPLLLDADALNCLAPGIPSRDYPTVISPHPGEMSRLMGNSIKDVLADPLKTCLRAAREWGCIVILKGASSYIADPQGNAAVNITGTDGLATGGSGDVLSGLILGLLAQGVEPFAAACTATWLLGKASELTAKGSSTASQLPRDVVNQIGIAISYLEAIST